MSETTTSLLHKIESASDLHAVVRTMKAVAASSVGQYENAVRSLDDYYHTVRLGLVACFRDPSVRSVEPNRWEKGVRVAIVFGSDQGLVGQFNDVMVDFVLTTLADLPGEKVVWVVGERVASRFEDTSLVVSEHFPLPNSIQAISPLIGGILTELETRRERNEIAEIYLFHNRPIGSIYTPVSQRLLPLDETWNRDFLSIPWPTNLPPEVMNGTKPTLLALIREYLFVSLFRACAESLASENASRLAAMQRAEKNIDGLIEDMQHTYHRLRKGKIDEELFDLISGFESIGGGKR